MVALAQQNANRNFGFANPLFYQSGGFMDIQPQSPEAVVLPAGQCILGGLPQEFCGENILGFATDVAWTFDYHLPAIGTAPGFDNVTGLGVPNGAGFFNATCTPTTCAAQGKNCGWIYSGCATVGWLNCGSCSGGQICGEGGTANVCGGTCTPICNSTNGCESDGCGGVCGTCGAGSTCVYNAICTCPSCPAGTQCDPWGGCATTFTVSNYTTGSAGSTPGTLRAQQVHLTQKATVQDLQYFEANTGGNQVQLGIYDSTGPGGGPGKLTAA
jgi:hypothetical protein